MPAAAMSPAATMPAAAVCRSTTGRSALTITMRIMAPIVAAATAPPPAPPASVINIPGAAAYEADASRHGGQHRHGQTDLDPARTRRNETAKRRFSLLFDIHIPKLRLQLFPTPWGVHPIN